MASVLQIKNDKSGGFMIVRVSDGQHHHRMRFHIPSFANAATPTGGIAPNDRAYTNPISREPSVAATFYELAICLRGMYNPNYHISLVALYTGDAAGVTYGTPGPTGQIFTPVYPIPAVIPIVGTSGGNNGWIVGQVSVYFPSTQGGRAWIKMIGSEEWGPTGRKDIVPAQTGSGATPMTITVAYLTGQVSGVDTTGNAGLGNPTYGASYHTGSHLTQIMAHDGGEFNNPATKTNCMNKRVRRSYQLT